MSISTLHAINFIKCFGTKFVLYLNLTIAVLGMFCLRRDMHVKDTDNEVAYHALDTCAILETGILVCLEVVKVKVTPMSILFVLAYLEARTRTCC